MSEAGAALKERIRAQALALGFSAVQFASAETDPKLDRDFNAYIADGRHGDMDWLARTPERRTSPQGLWPEAKSVIVLGDNYGPATDPRASLDDPTRGTISVYARSRDYHDVMKKKLKALARWLAEHEGAEVKVFVDTAPVMEKPLAQRAGLGWQGRHTNLVSRQFGSWLFLGEVFTTLDLPPDAAETDHCGSCHDCEPACPTGALVDGRIEPRRCISYQTIENKGHIPRELRAHFGNRIYGCDDCLAACPWNKFASPTAETSYVARADLDGPLLADLARLDDAAFRAMFSGSPIKRLGRDRFLRNVLIAIGNSGRTELVGVAIALLNDASPLVRAMAVWAARRLLPDTEIAPLAIRYRSGETDPDVQAEWTAQAPRL
ncbi:MAG TPA: tRNA epoxyqueuosine(34) reductase QueG [Magnetospirillaceae bacterium]|jgi:epoxyqueuosine reductase